MTRSRRARREAAREREKKHPASALPAVPRSELASDSSSDRVSIAKKPAKSAPRAGRAWYRDPRFQQIAYLIASAAVVSGLAYVLYSTQTASMNPTPTTGIASIATVPPTVTPVGTPAAARKTYTEPFPMTIDVTKKYIATLDTTKGQIVMQLDPSIAPITVNNFVSLARDGFYDGLTFHRVESWVLQGGDPVGNGTGGPGYRFNDEPVQGDYSVGAVAMANSGPNTNGSQFFIMKQPQSLPKSYNLFGTVTSGMNVVQSMAVGDRMTKVTITEQ